MQFAKKASQKLFLARASTYMPKEKNSIVMKVFLISQFKVLSIEMDVS